MSSINFWPPKPGSTVITSAMSICPAHGAISSTVVLGFMARPTFMPLCRISLIRFPTLSEASRWKVYWLAPAVAIG
uniref:Uncharacterized protein n=1 Tax=Anguilla anguilla TaxID=7936 RepID=A0A0E9XCK6_ANGAN